MPDEKKKQLELDPLTPEERQHFSSRGEKDIPVAAPPNDVPPAQAPAPADDAPPAEPVPSPAPVAEAEKQREVPQQALHEERKRRQDAEEKARQYELLNARMEERFRAFRDAVAPPQQAPAAAPSPDSDIFGAVKHMQQEQSRTRVEIDNYKRQMQYEDQMKQLRQWGADAEANYARNTPDYYEALNHLRRARANELGIWGMSPSAIGQQLQHEENQLLARAAAERRNPAEMAYSLAKQRGFVKADKPPAAQAAAPPPPPDLSRIEAGQRQSGSLSQIGGNQGPDVGDIEINDLLKMNDKEFGAFIDKYPARFRRLKGAAH